MKCGTTNAGKECFAAKDADGVALGDVLLIVAVYQCQAHFVHGILKLWKVDLGVTLGKKKCFIFFCQCHIFMNLCMDENVNL